MLLELIQTVEDTAASSGIVTVLVDNLSKAIARVGTNLYNKQTHFTVFLRDNSGQSAPAIVNFHMAHRMYY